MCRNSGILVPVNAVGHTSEGRNTRPENRTPRITGPYSSDHWPVVGIETNDFDGMEEDHLRNRETFDPEGLGVFGFNVSFLRV